QQQKLQDAALVPVNEQVKISISNPRIALEKIQLDVIFKQFWYTITHELSTQKFYFTMGDQVIEVNEDLLRSNIDFAKLIWDEFKHQIKTISKALKDPAYGMPILDVMFNKVIKASTDYSEYLAKSTRSTPAQATGRGKGLLTKDGVEFTVKTVSIPKRKRSQTVTEEIGRSEEAINDEVDSKKTNEEEVEPLVRCRFTGVSIGSEA
ncbi:hypothetical protein Tco_0083127, partial [Tanacetum coccineum]